MFPVGNKCRSTIISLLAQHFHLRVHRNGRHTTLFQDGSKCFGSFPFQEANTENKVAASSSSEPVPQTLSFENFQNLKPSQQNYDPNYSPHPDKLGKPKKYFNVDFSSGNSVDTPQSKQFRPKNNKSKDKTSRSRKASVHQLLHLAKQGHIHQAENMFQQLEESGKFRVGEGLLLSLLGMYIAAEQLPPALTTLSRLHALHPHIALSTVTALSLATMMLHHQQTNECIKLLADEAALIAEAADSSAPTTGYDHCAVKSEDSSVAPEKDEKPHKKPVQRTVYSDKLCHTLLMVPASQGDVSTTEKVLEELLCHHYAKPSRALLGPLVHARIASRDWDGALSTLQRLAQEHNCLPCRPELMRALAKLKDTDRLQRVVELSAELLGRENALLDLAVCFLESDDTDKAIKVLQEMESALSPARMQYLCQYYTRHRNTRCLGHLLTVVRTSGSLQDVQLVCSHLLHIYDERKESDTAAELLRAEGLTRQQLPPVTGLQTPTRKQTDVANGGKTLYTDSRD